MSLLSPDVLKALQAEYIKGFAEKRARIDKLLEIEDWSGLEREFHRFAGSGTTYKMPEISKISKALELYLEKNVPPDSKTINDAIALFKKVLDARVQGQVVNVEEQEAYQRILS